MSDLSASNPSYFPDTFFVWHMEKFPSSFRMASSIDEITEEAKIVATYSLQYVNKVVRAVRFEKLEKQGE